MIAGLCEFVKNFFLLKLTCYTVILLYIISTCKCSYTFWTQCWRAVLPELSLKLVLAPLAMRIFRTWGWFFIAAKCRGVNPCLFLRLMSHLKSKNEKVQTVTRFACIRAPISYEQLESCPYYQHHYQTSLITSSRSIGSFKLVSIQATFIHFLSYGKR